MDRRDFLKTATTAVGVAATEQFLTPMLRAEGKTPESDGMIYRTLGRTGERISAIGLGGYHIGKPSLQEQESIQLVRRAIDHGITFMDNCWDYNDGVSEVRMGKALAGGYRNKVFLMTKIDGRTKASAAQQIDESLQRLQTDHVDLMQFHEVIRLEDPDRIFAEGGAMEAMLDAKKAAKVRYIGFTGHKDPYVHLRMLDYARWPLLAALVYYALRRLATLRRDGAEGNRSQLLVVLRYDEEVRNGADEGASVLRNRLVAMEDDFKGNVGAVLGAGVVDVLREDGAREVKAGEEALAARVGQELGAHARVRCGLGVASHRSGRGGCVRAQLELAL